VRPAGRYEQTDLLCRSSKAVGQVGGTYPQHLQHSRDYGHGEACSHECDLAPQGHKGDIQQGGPDL
jgi:hypothetical protein